MLQFATENGMKFMEVSAQENINIDAVGLNLYQLFEPFYFSRNVIQSLSFSSHCCLRGLYHPAGKGTQMLKWVNFRCNKRG